MQDMPVEPLPDQDRSLPKHRRRARRLLIQALYQHQLAKHPLSTLVGQFHLHPDMIKADPIYFHDLLKKVVSDLPSLETIFVPFLDRPENQLGPVERAILWLGTTELRDRLDVPAVVILNESIELAKTFGATDAHAYINAVLEKVGLSLRASELTRNKVQKS
jgi:N utilization substance protein B